jgi:hypothetical protein
MPIFKNLKGEFFHIPASDLEKFAISEADARSRLSTAKLEGGEVHSDDMDDEVTGRGGSVMHQRTL